MKRELALFAGSVMLLATLAGSAYGQCANASVVQGNVAMIPGDTDTGNHGDDETVNVAFPFAVSFYGNSYSAANVSSNGNIQFVTSDVEYFNECLPVGYLGAAFMPHWDDLYLEEPGEGIFTSVTGTPGSRIFSIEWRAEYYASANPINFSVQFHEDSTDIDVVYANVPENGASATIGTQDGAGTFTQFACNSGGISSGTSLTFTCVPAGACCTANGCSIMTAANCGGAGGQYNGDGTSCGTDSYTFSPGGAFSSIAGSGSLLATVSDCDDCTESVSLPFSFTFYGNTYSSVNVSSNGNLQFDGASGEYFNGPIPSGDEPNNAIYPLWDDYNPFEQGDVYMLAEGTSPNRTVTIEWNNVTQYTAAGFYPLTSETFQAILHENNTIEFRYGSITPTLTDGLGQGSGVDSSGGDRTIGVENMAGSMASSIPSTGFTGASQLLTFTLAPNVCGSQCGTSDFDGDGDSGTDADIEAFFACLGGNCCATCFSGGADFDGDGDVGTDADIEAFFRVLAGNPC